MAIITTFTTGKTVHNILKGYKGTITCKVDLSLNSDITNSDVIECIKVEDGMYVTEVSTAVGTASGGTLTATVGDGSGANSWDASVNLNATAGTSTRSALGTDTYATTGKLYTAADTIDITLSNNAPGTTGVFYVTAEYIRLY